MAQRFENASDFTPTSGYAYVPVEEGSQPQLPPYELPSYNLPQRYGMPLLELLVVDPEFVFISWEITEAQLEEARQRFGEEGFFRRRLRVDLLDSSSGANLASRELYGDLGRWFIELGHPDTWLRAELNYVYGDEVLSLSSAGPVFVPRTAPVEPAGYRELQVIYGRGPKGELRLDGFQQATPSWPSVSLESSLKPVKHDGGASGSMFSLTQSRHVDPNLLRPLLPVAPAALPEETKE